jgi:hypothetical protein
VRFSDSIEYESQAQTKCGCRSRLTQMKDAYIYTIQYPTEKGQKDKYYAENHRLSNTNPIKTRG